MDLFPVRLLFFCFFQILKWFAQMCAGAKHIHDKRVLHRDLKSKVQWSLDIMTVYVNRCYFMLKKYRTDIINSTYLVGCTLIESLCECCEVK